MINFLRKTFYYLVSLSAIIFVVIKTFELFVGIESNFRLDKNVKYIVLGHSHPECAFNDSVIKNFKNLSQSGESYYYTYFKAREILKHNPSIETVFIEFTNNQIDESMNNWIWEEKYMNYRYPIYSPFISLSDKMVLAKNNFSGYMNALSLSLKYNLNKLINRDFNYSEIIGGYQCLGISKVDSLIMNDRNSIVNSHDNKISDVNLSYLEKTIEYCKNKGKNVFIIRSPQHKKYQGYSNEDFYQKIIRDRFKTVKYLDFAFFSLRNKEYADLEHLNYMGGKIFSIWFNEILAMDILNKYDSQELITREIQQRNDKLFR